jgi:hypothetical protein
MTPSLLVLATGFQLIKIIAIFKPLGLPFFSLQTASSICGWMVFIMVVLHCHLVMRHQFSCIKSLGRVWVHNHAFHTRGTMYTSLKAIYIWQIVLDSHPICLMHVVVPHEKSLTVKITMLPTAHYSSTGSSSTQSISASASSSLAEAS